MKNDFHQHNDFWEVHSPLSPQKGVEERHYFTNDQYLFCTKKLQCFNPIRLMDVFSEKIDLSLPLVNILYA